MRVAFAMLAEAAMLTPDQRVSILGGGIYALTFPTLPASMARLDLVVRLEFDQEDLNKAFTFRAYAVDMNGSVLAEAEEGLFTFDFVPIPDIPEEIARRISFRDYVVHFPRIGFGQEGPHLFRVSVNGEPMIDIPLFVFAQDGATATDQSQATGE